tara:strand:+ start:4469 stop:5005 length:537 start_codon:yes stop_codon:yes gene_type:complete
MIELKEPILINDILPMQSNIDMLNFLCESNFTFGGEIRDQKQIVSALCNDHVHHGFSLITRDINEMSVKKTPLNVYAHIIIQHITQKLDIKKYTITRFNWNYYYRGMEGTGHVDEEEDCFISILYNPHTTDGGTEIKGITYPDKISQAKIFKSNWMHRGTTTKQDKARFNLNIVIKIA